MTFHYSKKAASMRPSIIRGLLKQMADPSLISFAGGNPDPGAFPVEQIRAISDELLRDEASATLQYSITEGYPPLIEAGKGYLNREWDVVGEGDGVIITAGSQQVMDLFSRLVCDEGDLVAVDDPAFLGALNSFRAYGVRLAGVPLQPDGPDLAALEAILAGDEKPRFFYTIPNFQNPTGAVTSLEKRKAVYALCTKHGVPILEDNPYGELRIEGEGLPPIKSFDRENAVVYAVSMSKVLSPGMRVAFCVGQQALLSQMVMAKQGNDVHTNLWGQRVCERFLTRCDVDAHLARLRGIYREKALLMADEMERHLHGKIHFERPKGGMFLWATLQDGIDVGTFVQKCLENKLAIVPGSAFFVDESAPCQSVRLNFSTPTKQQIVQGVSIMEQVLSEMQQGAR
ncbi:PLP-dependent aminotransferase family protein [Ruminococcaceae bacterium OttesenSCG-928-I18]|nr:PLP-dependent aminotransferase family protein [Ruminococcaceae bacterium OttesenSCG-928-I18]